MKILIVGAGLCGLSVAKALQNLNIYPDIIEKEGRIRSDGTGIAIPANGSWALNKLGIDLCSQALLIQSMQIIDDQGEILAQERTDAIHPDGAQFYSIARNQLMEQLVASLDKRMQIHTSTTLKCFSEENDQVRVEFSTGEVKTYDLLIGCDGIYSSLRGQVHPDEVPEFLGLLVWRAVIESSEEVSIPTYMLGSDRLVLLYPMPNNQMYIYGQLFQPERDFPSESFSRVFSCFGGLLPKALHGMNQNNLTHHPVPFRSLLSKKVIA